VLCLTAQGLSEIQLIFNDSFIAVLAVSRIIAGSCLFSKISVNRNPIGKNVGLLLILMGSTYAKTRCRKFHATVPLSARKIENFLLVEK
jgi:hypothetical protein